MSARDDDAMKDVGEAIRVFAEGAFMTSQAGISAMAGITVCVTIVRLLSVSAEMLGELLDSDPATEPEVAAAVTAIASASEAVNALAKFMHTRLDVTIEQAFPSGESQ